ncbi:hypothetical protein C2G38_2207313 [Gigaspora rosea]|uniref:Uncharacterized protein n=1 Tax=Gigaspora rosea TaxID=44941 RepID=A0A397UI59_9GLOM|nr:hypothetical protein C2G38_2207313 [Gigaspora rosea]
MGPIRDPQDMPERELSAKSTLKGWCIIKVIKKSRKTVSFMTSYLRLFGLGAGKKNEREKGRKRKGTRDEIDKKNSLTKINYLMNNNSESHNFGTI